MTFARPWLLLFLPLLMALAGWASRRCPPALRIPSLAGLEDATAAPRPPLGPLLLELGGAVALLFVLAGPQQAASVSHERREALDLVLALDISGSMDLYDGSSESTPEDIAEAVRSGGLNSRLDVAKTELARFVEARPADRVGLLVFAQRPYLACPPTFDHRFLLRRLEQLETGLVPDGTSIAGAIVAGADQLRDSPAPRRVLVLFTDGEENVAAPLSPLQAAELAREDGTMLHIVGMGGEHAFVRRRGLARDRFAPVPPELAEDFLRRLAASTGGLYLPAADAGQFAEAMRRIDAFERVPVEYLVSRRVTDRSAPFLVLALVLLLAGLFLSRTRCLTVP
ncbi:MAG: VWA domain-containing protein [Lentisphaeria bacterium]|jgi:Ca-activated chloride channel family protein|nr:VWA domain-containing protein [Lentisphaeria bacterium]